MGLTGHALEITGPWAAFARSSKGWVGEELCTEVGFDPKSFC